MKNLFIVVWQGNYFGNEFLCVIFDEMARRQFKKGDLVEADLGFHVVKLGKGSYRQAVVVNHIQAVGKNG